VLFRSYFAGHSQNRAPDLTRAVHIAQSALAQFDLVGDLSNPTQFARDLCHLTGGPLPWLHRNRAPVTTFVPPGLYQRIATLCAADIAIYHAARNRMAA